MLLNIMIFISDNEKRIFDKLKKDYIAIKMDIAKTDLEKKIQ